MDLPLAEVYGPAVILTNHREFPLSERRMVLYTYSAPRRLQLIRATRCRAVNIGVPEPVLHKADILPPIGHEGAPTISSSTAIRWSAKTVNTPNVFKLGQYKKSNMFD